MTINVAPSPQHNCVNAVAYSGVSAATIAVCCEVWQIDLNIVVSDGSAVRGMRKDAAAAAGNIY